MYTIGKLARLAGVTTRTLRYYDQIGLLRPSKTSEAGYRQYGKEQVDALQQILFYRALGVGPEEIRRIMQSPDFDAQAALEKHLSELVERRGQLDALIDTVAFTLKAKKEGIDMTDADKFEGFKQKLIDDNEWQYGEEVRERYGDEAMDQSNAKLMGMTPAQYTRMEALVVQVNGALKAAMASGDVQGAEATHLCKLHKEWLMCSWSSYSAKAHRGLAQMYVDDERFAAYYDSVAPCAAVFLRDALLAFLPQE